MSPVFFLVYSLLQAIASLAGLSYEAVNVVIWYVLIPATYLFLIDRIIHRFLLLPLFIAFVAIVFSVTENLNDLADRIFNSSVAFLLGFSRIGMGYDLASVVICVWIPLLALLVLAVLAFPKWFEKRAPIISRCILRKRSS
jgi:hypothetical protein